MIHSRLIRASFAGIVQRKNKPAVVCLQKGCDYQAITPEADEAGTASHPAMRGCV